MTECARCGVCCESISIQSSPYRMDKIIQDNLYATDDFDEKFDIWLQDANFILDNWIYHGPDNINGHNYSCSRFDSETRLCTAHNERPPVCSRYPWYGKEPKPYESYVPIQCSFNADVRKMLPIVEVK